MELTAITFKKGKLEVTMEKNNDTSYSVSIWTRDKDLGVDKVGGFRTDEVNIDDIIEALKFCKNYNFIQENKNG